MRPMRRIALLVAVAGLASCQDPAGPVLPDGIYKLVGVNGQPVPGTLPGITAGCDVGLEQGQLMLRGGSATEFFINYWRGVSCPGFGGSGTYFNLTGFSGTLTQQGSVLSFASQLPSGALATFAGSLGPKGLELVVQDTSLGFAGIARLRFAYEQAFPPELTQH